MKLLSTILIGLFALPRLSAEALPELAGHDFFYAGEAKTQDLYIVRKGEIVWSHHNPGSRGEISDAVLLSNGNVLYAHQYGITLMDAGKKVLWRYETPEGCETHTARPIGTERVVFLENGRKPRCVVVNVKTGKTEREFPLEVGNPQGVHGQFRHAELTTAGTLLVAHMDHGKVAEYDEHGKELWSVAFPGPWSASRLPDGNTLITATKLIREVDPAGKTVWECTPADLPGLDIRSFQISTRLPNGSTLINNWVNSWSESLDPDKVPEQAYEITPDKKVVWKLDAWKEPANLGPSTTIQLLDKPDAPEARHFGGFR
ncbi:PQQ-binding-like beta-propeller repeat protein [Luteolibacter marinus]|uniref:beta-propeller domain-containing protein n=1 Tax=Luteolibacter marinus TaxID=2776705 RepID=UPI0018683B2C|nr:PQQ-binding-like beta-propeller repeat protein [Luteolibacter marinus]